MRAIIKIIREVALKGGSTPILLDEVPLNFDLEKVDWFHIDPISTDRDIIVSVSNARFRFKHEDKILTLLNNQMNRRR